MSFFGLKTAPTEDRPSVYDFEDTYDDGLGNALQETNDDFNDETFGDFEEPVGKDFDFAGQTAQVSDAIDEEQFTYARTSIAKRPSTVLSVPPSSDSVPSLQPIASLWGTSETSAQQQQQQQQQQSSAQPQQQQQQPKILSLEEVEAQMLASSRKQQQQPPMAHGFPPQGFPPQGFPPQGFPGFPPQGFPPQVFPGQGYPPQGLPPQGLPPQGLPQGFPTTGYPPQQFPPPPNNQGFSLPQDPAVLMATPGAVSGGSNQPGYYRQQLVDPRQQQQSSTVTVSQNKENKNLESGTGTDVNTSTVPYSLNTSATAVSSSPSGGASGGNVVSLGQVINEDLAKSEAEHQRLFEKSRKIAEIVKYNGLMSQWDKNFIMRIQLQQMVTADPYNEDFYYQVHSAIQARNNPQQPLNEFARTYLLQRGQRGGARFRRHNDNPLQRMQQQVQQAVAAAKEHPKKEQIAPEGALGKISVGTGNRPRRALNVSGAASTAGATGSASPSSPSSASLSSAKVEALQKLTLKTSSNPSGNYSTKGLLGSIEAVYSILLEIESVERSRPQSIQDPNELQQQANDGTESGSPSNAAAATLAIAEWENKMQTLVDQVWTELQVLEPVDNSNNQPFILMLSHDKGKKVIPRIFRHLSQKQRLTVLTRIVAHIESLDVVKEGSYKDSQGLPAKTRESIELFSQTVLPPLVHLVSESSYDVVIGLLEIMLNSCDMVHVSSTKIGLAFLTVLISRAELISQDDSADAVTAAAHAKDIENWQVTFNTLFTRVQGHLASIFPPRNVDNSYVWHFLASLALAAKLEHQRVIVDEVREMIFGTMAEAKALPIELSVTKIANLNLFLNVMGLNATTTEISELVNQ